MMFNPSNFLGSLHDEHEGNTLGFDEVLIPGTRQQIVNKGGDVTDVDAAVLVAVCIIQIDVAGIIGQQIIDQCRHVADVYIAVTVHVATQAGILRGEVARVAGAAIDVGVFGISVAGIVGRALTAHQSGAVLEHIARGIQSIVAPTVTGIDGGKMTATIEHQTHAAHKSGVEATQVKTRQTSAVLEHAPYVLHFCCVETAQVKTRQAATFLEHIEHVC